MRKTGRELRFHRWDWSGAVTVRFQYGLPVESVFGQDTRLQIDPIDTLAWTSPQRAVRRRLSRSTVRIRIGTERRSPVWLELPVILHRPMPEAGVIRSASVMRDRLGGHDRWRLLVTVESPEPEARSGPAAAIDLGWRITPRGLRVAYWEDEQGRHGELRLNRELLWEFSKLRELQSAEDRLFHEVRQVLAKWAEGRNLPEWLDLSRILQWRGYGRLLRVHRTWSTQRFEDDGPGFAAIEAWRRQHLPLASWEDHLRDQVLRRRREVYRRFAARLLQEHGTVYLEDFDLRALARRAGREKEGGSYTGPARVIAAPSVLRRVIEEKGGCVRVEPGFTTQQCSWCGLLERWDASVSISHCCAGCGRWFDQDRNAARNILHRGLELAGKPPQRDGEAPAPPRIDVVAKA